MPLTIIGSRFYMSQSPRDFYVGLCFDRPSVDGVPRGEPTAGDYTRELTRFIYSDASAELSNSDTVRFQAVSDWGVMSYVVVSQVPSGLVFGYQVIPPQVMSAGTVLEIDVGDLIIGTGVVTAQATSGGGSTGEHFHTWGEITGKPNVFPPQAEMLSLNQLADVTTSGVLNGQVIEFQSGAWVPGAGSGGGGGVNEVFVGTSTPTDPDVELWYDEDAVATGGGGGSVAWADITGKPTTFPPSEHTHEEEIDPGVGGVFYHRAGAGDPSDLNNYPVTVPTIVGGGVLWVVVESSTGGVGGAANVPALTMTGATFTTARTVVWGWNRLSVLYSQDYNAGTSVSLGIGFPGQTQQGCIWTVEEQIPGWVTGNPIIQSNDGPSSSQPSSTTLAAGSGGLMFVAGMSDLNAGGTPATGTELFDQNISSPVSGLITAWDPVVRTNPTITWAPSFVNGWVMALEVKGGGAEYVPPHEHWVELTQAAYDALAPPDPDILYLIVG